MTTVTKKRTLAKIRKEDPVSYVILMMKGDYEGSINYAYKNWSDPIDDMEGWKSYREAAVWSLENNGDGIPADSNEEVQKLVTQYANMPEEYKEKMRVKQEVAKKAKKKK